MRSLVEQEPIRKLITRLEDRDAESPVTLADAAFWVKGCSSLGLWRVAALVEFHTTGRKHRPAVALLDIKQAIEASAPWAPDVNPGVAPGVRVVMGARHLAPALGSRMLAASMLERSVFIRELLPQDLKVELDRIDATDARKVAYYLGKVVGRAHRRQLDPTATRAWLAELTQAPHQDARRSELAVARARRAGRPARARLPRALPSLRAHRGICGTRARIRLRPAARRARTRTDARDSAGLLRESLGHRIALHGAVDYGFASEAAEHGTVGRWLHKVFPVKRNEAVTVALLAINCFVLLTCYYVLKVVREPLILLGGGAELKAYASAGQTLLLLGVVPAFGWLSSRVSRIRLLTTMQLIFIGCLVAFYVLAQAKAPIGLAFYLWLGIFNVLVRLELLVVRERPVHRGDRQAAVRGDRRRREHRRDRRRVRAARAAQVPRHPRPDAVRGRRPRRLDRAVPHHRPPRARRAREVRAQKAAKPAKRGRLGRQEGRLRARRSRIATCACSR